MSNIVTNQKDKTFAKFSNWLTESNIELYRYQTEAIQHLANGDNVVLSTPTGSGKSLVAFAGAFAMLANDHKTVYTAPTKALVNEKFGAYISELTK